MRMTVPKSQGKQPFYDARKSSWGDIFPHPPKNPPQVRYESQRVKGKQRPIRGADIGKRGGKENKEGVTYESLAIDLRSQRKKSHRDKIAFKRQSEERRDEGYDSGASFFVCLMYTRTPLNANTQHCVLYSSKYYLII